MLPTRPSADEVDELLLNARLRDELEPYVEESLQLLDCRRMPTAAENDFLASMLAWEQAPILPISRWFEPELKLPSLDKLSDDELSKVLMDTLDRLYEARIVLDFTDHLSDRQLYCLLIRDILPSPEKKLDRPRNYLHWHCLDPDDDCDNWLRYYASPEEREGWAEETHEPLPEQLPLPYPRRKPRRRG